jgi:hypothetical protein
MQGKTDVTRRVLGARFPQFRRAQMPEAKYAENPERYRVLSSESGSLGGLSR